MTIALVTERLTKRFGAHTAVGDLCLNVREGDRYGLLGLNGAGKTTTLRMVTHLIRPDSGKTFIFGRDLARDFRRVLREVGALVELPCYYPYLTARENLQLLAPLVKADRKQVDDLLDRLGLGAWKERPARIFSHGMRQRLGIAAALLGKPRLVILDEPTNGLDPQGIQDIRELVREYNEKHGITFLISSHLLAEVEKTATRVGMMRQGELVREEDLERTIRRSVRGVRVAGEPRQRAAEVARGLPFVQGVLEADGVVEVACPPENFADVNAALQAAGVRVSEVTPIRSSLEDIFLSISRP